MYIDIIWDGIIRMRKIDVIGTRGFPYVPGGVERHCEELYTRLSGKYHILVYRRKQMLSGEQKHKKFYRGISFIDISVPVFKGIETFYHSFVCTIISFFRKPDIVHYHNIGPGVFAPILKIRKIKTVLTYHSQNYLHNKWNILEKKFLLFCESVSVKNADHVIVLSEEMKSYLHNKYKKTSIVIPNGINKYPKSFDVSFLKKNGIKIKKYILFVGRISEEKGTLDLVNAYINGSFNVQLVIVGGADYHSQYYESVRAKAGKYGIIMTGYLTGNALNQLYSNALLFVLPSHYEGQPIALLEAMSFNLPIILSDITPNQTLGLDPSFYYQSGKVKDLEQRIRFALNECKKIDYSKILVKYNWDNIAEKTQSLF